MTNPYQTWIQTHYPTATHARLQCFEATTKMVVAFPELRQARGHIMVGVRLRPHWWCVTPDGTVIDPTAIQYKIPPLFYDEIPVDAEEPPCKL